MSQQPRPRRFAPSWRRPRLAINRQPVTGLIAQAYLVYGDGKAQCLLPNRDERDGRLRFDAGAFANTDTPTIDDALRQLGLQLQPARGSGEFLVIDHLEPPSPD